ncbi:hypothetical protein ACLOAU_10455 [Niabella sp. CJ426]|uniref:hypothetical protein n=1 Tax=Niabella sp. CJ426 TaxID=3393740 RepID=UPI003D05E23D
MKQQMKRSMMNFYQTPKEFFGQENARLTGRAGICEVPRPTGLSARASNQIKK